MSLATRLSPEEENRVIKLATVTQDELVVNVGQLKLHSVVNGDLSNGASNIIDVENTNASLAEFRKSVKARLNFEKKQRQAANVQKSKNSSLKGKRKKLKDNLSTNSNNKLVKAPTGMDLFLKKIGKPSVIKKRKGDTIIIDDDDDDDQPLSSRFNVNGPLKTLKFAERSSSSSRKSSTPRKKKQATLLELTKKGSGIKLLTSPTPTKNAKSSPSKPRKPRQPLIVLQLLSLKKEKKFRIHKYKMTVTT